MKDPLSYRVDFEPVGKSAAVWTNSRILDAARKAGIDLPVACGGNGKCGTCRVKIVGGRVTEPTPEEHDLLTAQELARGYRLACCTSVLSDLTVHLPKESLASANRLQIDCGDRLWPVDPMILAYDIEVPAPSLHDPRSDLERVSDVMAKEHRCFHLTADPLTVSRLSRELRDRQWHICGYVRSGELIGTGPPNTPPLGFAVDVGTTKIAAYLFDLNQGCELAADGLLNPQTRYGDDIMSRLQYVCQHPGSPEMASLIRTALNDLLHKLADRVKVNPAQVTDACIVGNTAIIHLLLELPVRQLAVAPYVAASSAAVNIKARELGLDTAPGALVHILPSVGGFVGADHVAMILGTDIDRQDCISIGVDIGTNTEIVLRDPGASHLFSLSCPSGPAFEGAHVTSGMRAASGAIEAVQITPSGVQLKTIDHEPAIGLCGSGIIDVVAELYRLGIINERGRLQTTDPRVRKGQQGNEFLLSPAAQNGIEGDIVVTQKDVDEIQLAKGAIHAGIDVLLEETRIMPEAVRQVFIAGAFGSYLSITSAVAIGLLPYFPKARYLQVGNTAAVGAIQALLSAQARRRAGEIAANTKYVELTTHSKFTRRFAQGMMFPKKQILEEYARSRAVS